MIDDFNLTPGSPCIDAGNPLSPRDPDGTIVDMGALYFNQTGGALFVPAWPENFTVSPNMGDLIASLSWTNPAVNAINEPLTELLGVLIYRGEDLIADVTDVVIGQPYEFDDENVPSAGTWEYEIVPYNSFGNGLSVENSAWIGMDVPGAAQNVAAIPDPGFGLSCTIQWSDPIEGMHQGYYPVTGYTGQKIYREGFEIANLTGSNTSFEDTNIPHNGFYSYAVMYYNDSGDGEMTPASPNPVFVGPPLFQVIPYDWVEISTIGTNTGVTGDDQTLGPFPIGFEFPYYDNNYYNQIWVCSNGWLSFSSGQGSGFTNYAIPTITVPNNIVCPYWDDLTPAANSGIYYYNDVVNNRFIVEYSQVPHYSTGGSYTFEAIFYPNGDIDLLYNDLTHGTANTATVGVENAAGNDGIQVTYNGSGPLNPVNEMAIRVYSVAGGIPDATITLTPATTPIQIPAGGGSFEFTVEIINNETAPITIDAWTDVTLPNGGYYPILTRPNLTLGPGGSIFRTLLQNVPATAPVGNYAYNGYLGSHPNVVFTEDNFPFEKLAAGDGFNPDNTWNLYGWDGDYSLAQLPTEFDLKSAFPNPFNPQTTLRYDLPREANASMIIYDIQGRVVNELVKGWHQAGSYEVTFDAQGLASGVYFVRYNAGTYNETQKLLLVK